jgi:hypothetical protein
VKQGNSFIAPAPHLLLMGDLCGPNSKCQESKSDASEEATQAFFSQKS